MLKKTLLLALVISNIVVWTMTSGTSAGRKQ